MAEVIRVSTVGDWSKLEERIEEEAELAVMILEEELEWPRHVKMRGFDIRVVVSSGEIRDMFEVVKSSRLMLETVVFRDDEDRYYYESGEEILPCVPVRFPRIRSRE